MNPHRFVFQALVQLRLQASQIDSLRLGLWGGLANNARRIAHGQRTGYTRCAPAGLIWIVVRLRRIMRVGSGKNRANLFGA
ncbi:MAG: hypothetical protein EBS52_06935 [Betaproteobacteria bacterium]|nr:hypothetical protein [Betaproteobacteria bacterium]